MRLDQKETKKRMMIIPIINEKKTTFFKETRENGHITILGTILPMVEKFLNW